MTKSAGQLLTGETLLEWESGGSSYVARRLMGHLVVERDGRPAYEVQGRLYPYGVPFAKPWRREELEPLEPIITLLAEGNNGKILAAAKGLWQALAFLTDEERAELDDPDLRMVLLSVDGLSAHFMPPITGRERATALWKGDCSLAAVFEDLSEDDKLVMLRKHCRGAEQFPELFAGLRDAAMDFDPINVGRVVDPTPSEKKRANKIAGHLKGDFGEDLDARTDAWLRQRFSNGQPAYVSQAEKWMERILGWYQSERPAEN